jgi:hypothetical protein
MAKRPLSHKFHFKTGHRIYLLNPPEGFEHALMPMPTGVTLFQATPKKPCDAVILFATDLKQLKPLLIQAKEIMIPGGIIWLSFPKKSSGQQSDLNIYTAREAAHELTYKGVAIIISVDEIWSACRLICS